MRVDEFRALMMAEAAPYDRTDSDTARSAVNMFRRFTRSDDILLTALFLDGHDSDCISEVDVVNMANDCAEIFLKETT